MGGGEVQVYRHYAHGRGGRLELGATETIGAESNGDRWGDGSSEAQGGEGGEIQNMVEKCGEGETSNKLMITKEPRFGEVPVRGWNITAS